VSLSGVGSGGRNSKQPRLMQLHISSRNGRTSVRGFEDMSPMAMGTFGGFIGGLGMGGGMATMGSILANGGGVVAIGSWLGILATSYGAARFVFGRTARKREAQLRETIERVVMVARQHTVKKLR